MNHKPLGVRHLCGLITGHARVVAIVVLGQSVNHQYAIVLIDAGDGDALRGAHCSAVLQPSDG